MSEYEEVEGTAVELKEGETIAPPPQQIVLNAKVIDDAYQKLKQALSDKLRLDMAVSSSQGLSAKDREELLRKAKTAGAVVDISKVEIDRVNALMTYFQIDFMYRQPQYVQQPPEQPA